MTSSIINFIVEKYLSNIVEINPEKTKSSLWSGTFEMNNLKIKKEIFETIDLPYCELVNGYIGTLTIKLQLPRFYLYPIKVYIDKVFFHARQKQLDKLNKNDELKGMENYKKSKLQSAEEFKCEINKLKNEEPGMVTQMINNVQITINDICVRFDDEISCPEIPFTFGILMKNIFIRTTDSTFEIKEDENSNIPYNEINHKVIRLNNLSMFLDTYKKNTKLNFADKTVYTDETSIDEDLYKFLGNISDFYKYCLSEIQVNINNASSHQYLLYGLGLTLKTSINDNLLNNQPKIKAVCELNPLTTSIGIEQIYTLLKLLAYINLNSLYRTGLAKEYYVKNLSDEEKIDYIKKYIEYYNYQYQKETQNLVEAENIKKQLNEVEEGLTYDQIQILRDGAMIQIEYNRNLANLNSEINNLKKESAGSKWNPMSYFSSGPSQSQQEQMSKLLKRKKELTQDQVNIDKQIEEILKKNQSTEIDYYKDLLDSFILYQIDFTMVKCVMNILENKTKSMIEISFDKLHIKGDMKKKGQFFSLFIDDIKIFQNNLPHSAYTTLMETVPDIDFDSSSENIIQSDTEQDNCAMYIEFENNPALEKSNYRFKFRNTKQLVITLNLYSIQYLSKKILEGLKSGINLHDLQKYAVGEVNKYISAGFVDNMLSGNYQHFNIDLDINIKSPIMLMPQNVCDESNKNCILIRFGDLTMKSILPPRQDFVKYNYLTEQNKNIMYDIYVLEGKNFYLLTMEEFSGNVKEINSAKKMHLIKDVTLKFTMENLIEAKNPHFDNLNMNLSIDNVRFSLRDSQIVFLINFLDGFSRVGVQLSEALDKVKSIEIEDDIIPVEEHKEEEKENEQIKEEHKEVEGRAHHLEEAYLNDLQKNPVGNILKKAFSTIIDVENQKQKVFLRFNFTLNNFEFTILKTLQSSERDVLMKSTLPEIHNKEYKDYITFNIDLFSIDVIMTEKADMIVNLQIYSLSLTDNEVLYTSENNFDGEPIIHHGFKKLISSTSKDDEIKKQNELISKIDEKKRFMNITYKYNSSTHKTEIDILMQNLYLIINFTTLAELYRFYQYYIGLLFANQQRLTKERNLKIKRDSSLNQDFIIGENEDNVFIEAENVFKGNKLVNEIDHKNGVIEYQLLETKNKQTRTAHLISLLKKRFGIFVDDTDINNELNLIKKQEESKTKITFSMKKVEMYLPLDPTKSETKLMNFSFNFLIKMNMHSIYETIHSLKYSNLLKMNYTLKDMNMSMMVYNISFDILNYNDNIKIRNVNNEKILSNFRINMNMEQFLINEENKNVMTILFSLEPITTALGFRELKKIQQFLSKSTQFLSDMNEPYNDPLTTYNPEELLRISSLNATQIAEQEEKELENKKKYIISSWKVIEYNNKNNNVIITSSSNQSTKLKKIKENTYTKDELIKKIKELTDKEIYNINSYNNQMDFCCQMDKISLKLIDNTTNLNTPLLNVEANKISFKYISNSNSKDIDNLSNVLVESLTSKSIDIKEYNLLHLYQYMDCYFNTEINFFNDKVNDWEPIVEPWNASFKLLQVGKHTTKKINFNSDTMLNLNLSVYSVKVFNSVMKKYSQDEQQWEKEDNSNQFNNKNSLNKSGLKIINKTGEKIYFHLGVESSANDKAKTLLPKLNNIINNQNENIQPQINENQSDNSNLYEINTYRYNPNSLDSLNRRFTEPAVLLVKKDKINIDIDMFSKIQNHDFSYYHYSTYMLREKKTNTHSTHLSKIENNSDNLLIPQPLNKNLTLDEPLLIETSSNDIANIFKSTTNYGLNFSKTIGVTVKTILSGLSKEIIIESNITLYNNLDFPIRLCFVLITSVDVQNNTIDFNSRTHMENTFEIQYKQSFAIPLKYLTKKYKLYSSIDKGKKYSLLYENFDFLNEELGNVMKYDEAISSNDNTNKEYNDIKKKGLNDKGSRLLQLEKEGKINYVTVDMMIHRGIYDKVEIKGKSKRTKNENINNTNENNKLVKTYSYYFVFNKAVLIENKVPTKLKIEILKGINDTNNNSYTVSNEINLTPLELIPLFDYDTSNNSNYAIRISMKYQHKTFTSSHISISNNSNNKLPIELTDSSDINNKLTLKLQITNNDISNNIYPETYLKLISTFTKGKHLLFYPDYIVVNKTDSLLYAKSSSVKSENIPINSYNGMFFPHEVSLFNTNKPTINIKDKESTWCKTFNIETFGMSGVCSLTKPSNTYFVDSKKQDELIDDIAVKISNSSLFTMSTILTFEYRFIIFNETNLDISFKQYHDKDVAINSKLPYISIEPKEQKVISFINCAKKFNKMIQLSIDNEFHSSAFKIDEIQNIDIKIPINDMTIVNKLLEINEQIKIENKKQKQTNKIKSDNNEQPKESKHKYLYHIFKQGSIYNLIIKVTIQSYDNGLIYIILHNPQYPEYQIRNETKYEISVYQKNSSFGKEKTIIPQRSQIPYSWSDMLQDNKLIICSIKTNDNDETSLEIQFGQIVHMEKQIGKEMFYMDVLLENKNKTRTFVIRNVNKAKYDKKENLFKIITGERKTSNMRFNVDIKGIGLSIIDNIPREVFYISMYGIDIMYLNLSYTKEKGIVDSTDNLQFKLKNFQVDYCLDDSFKCIVFPKEPLKPKIEEEKISRNEPILPFLQILFTRHTSYNPRTKLQTVNFPQIDFILQEFNVKVDQFCMLTLLHLQSSILNELDFYYSQSPSTSNNSNNANFLLITEDNNNVLENNVNPYSSYDIDIINNIITQSENPSNIYINHLLISAMKINLTLRLDLSIINIQILPGIVNKLIASLGNSLTRISDSPLRFSEMIHENVFTDSYNMIWLLINHYKRQGLLEAYKILGSSDLIGNPICFVEKIGTGFIEFFNEPRKAFLKGPSHYPSGIAKGIGSLVSNVVGGSFEVVGKITGTLFTAAKTIHGEKLLLREEDEPENVILGIYDGLKGGAKEIYTGITGIFKNPYENAKTGGVKGFFKGVGTGLVGAVVSPISAVLRVGNSVVVGMKNTLNMLNTKIKSERFRHPRIINSITALKPYDEASATVQAILKELDLFDDDEKVVYFKEEFKFMEVGFNNKMSTIIMTDKCLMVIYNLESIVFQVKLGKIENVEIHVSGNNEKEYLILFDIKKSKRKYIRTNDLRLCCELFSIFEHVIDKTKDTDKGKVDNEIISEINVV